MNRESSTGNCSDFSVYRASNWIDGVWMLGLWIAALMLFCLNLGGVPLRDWDEGTVAQVARELWRSADFFGWLHPTLWGEPYLNKPPLMHGLIAIAYHWGGVNEWTSRLPGALLTALSVPLLYGVARELFPRRTPAVFAGLLYLTLLPVVRHGRLAMLDGAVLCFSLVMMGGLLRARRDLRWAVVGGLGLGLLCLTKGLLGILLGAIALLFTVWDTPRLLRSPYLWWGLALGLLPVGLWYGAQWERYRDLFIQHTLLAQSLNRVWASVEGNRGSPFYYLWEILKGAWPWLIFWPAGMRYAWQHREFSWAKFGLCWSGVYFLVISFMETKLPWYVLPLYPPLALIGGMQLTRLWRGEDFTGMPRSASFRYARGWRVTFAISGMLGWGTALYFGVFAPSTLAELAWVFGAFALTLTVVAYLLAKQDAQFLTVLIWGTYVTLAILLQSNHWLWELKEAYPVPPIAALIKHEVPASTKVIYTSYRTARPSLDFYSDRPVQPKTDAQLRELWQKIERPYFLLDRTALQRLNDLTSQVTLQQQQGWYLITRSHSPAPLPEQRPVQQ